MTWTSERNFKIFKEILESYKSELKQYLSHGILSAQELY